MKSDKIIFAYMERDKTVPPFGEGQYKSVVAVNGDETERFSFVVNQDDYKQSVSELCKRFIEFCMEKCGFSKEQWGELWITDRWDDDTIPRPKLFFERTDCKNLEFELATSDFCALHTIEWEYTRKTARLKGALGFEAFKRENGYFVENEPYATKRLYYAYKQIIDKKRRKKQ